MNLKELRQQSKKTAAEVAERLGVSVQCLYNYENGARHIGIDMVISLAELFDVTEREVIQAQFESIAEKRREKEVR